MRITKGQQILSSLLMVGLLIGLSNCGSAKSTPGSPAGSKPDHVQIEIDRPSLTQGKAGGNPDGCQYGAAALHHHLRSPADA